MTRTNPVIAFAGIMHSHKIISIKRSQISILPDQMSIFCPVRKNDQRCQGHFVWHTQFGKRRASAASAAGTSGELLDKYAGWKAVKSKNNYISDLDRLDKLKVSRAINS